MLSFNKAINVAKQEDYLQRKMKYSHILRTCRNYFLLIVCEINQCRKLYWMKICKTFTY